MLVYILTGMVTFLSLRNYERIEVDKLTKENKWLKIFYKNLSIILLTLIFGLRDYTVGTDTQSYLKIFNWLGPNFVREKFIYEKGFCFLGILLNKIFGNFTVFLIFLGFIIYWNIVNCFCKLSKSPSISMLCYFGIGAFAQSCNLLRQYIALSFCLIALYFFIEKKKLIPFLLFVFIGYLFHKSALVFLLVIPLKYIRFNIITVSILFSTIILIIPLTSFIVKIIDEIFGSRYSIYLGRETNPFTFINIGTMFAMIVCIYLLVVFRKRVKDKTNCIKEYEFFANMFLLFVSVFIISLFSTELIDRIAIYFMPSIFFIIPIILKSFKNYISTFYIDLLVIVLIIVLTYLLIIRGSYGIIPYTFI